MRVALALRCCREPVGKTLTASLTLQQITDLNNFISSFGYTDQVQWLQIRGDIFNLATELLYNYRRYPITINNILMNFHKQIALNLN